MKDVSCLAVEPCVGWSDYCSEIYVALSLGRCWHTIRKGQRSAQFANPRRLRRWADGVSFLVSRAYWAKRAWQNSLKRGAMGLKRPWVRGAF